MSAYFNGKKVNLNYIFNNNAYTNTVTGNAKVVLDDITEGQSITVTVLMGDNVIPETELHVYGTNPSKYISYVTDNNGRAVVKGISPITTIHAISEEYTIKAEYNKSIPEAFDNINDKIKKTSEDVIELQADVEKNNTAITKIESDTAELWERTSCRTTKSGLTEVNITDADDTGDIYIKVTVVGEEAEGPSLFDFPLYIWNFENQDEYQTYDISNGEIVIKKPYPNFIASIPYDNRFYIEVTYNTSVSKGFDKLKEDVKKQAQTAISSWGGKNLANTLSPIDASLLTYTQANRFALMPPEYITWERSSDGGVTWEIANEVADSRKVLNVTTANSIFVLPNANAVNTSTLNRLRVTFDFPKGTLYAVLLKLIVEVFTGGAKGVTCEVSTSTYATPDTFVVRTEGELKGEPGYNVFQLNSILLGGYTSSRNTHTRKLRLTVKCDTLTSGRGNNFALSRIYAIAPTAFTTLNMLQKFGDLYQPDWQGNAVFQNGVKANTFTGNLTGAATRAIADEDGNNIIATYQRKDETVKCTYRYTSFTNVPKGYSETIFISTRGGLPDVKDILWIELCPYDETTTKYKSQLTIGEIIYNAETNNIELKSVYNHGEAIEDGQNYEMGFKMLVKSKSKSN